MVVEFKDIHVENSLHQSNFYFTKVV